MEKTASTEERIRRAEELYLKRKNFYSNREYKKQPFNNQNIYDKNNLKYRIKKKLWTQIIVCMILYFSLNSIINSNYFFSKSTQEKIEEFLSYDVDFKQIIYKIELYIKDNNDILKKYLFIDRYIENDREEEDKEVIDETEEISDSNEKIDEITENVNDAQVSEIVEESDAEYIKNNYEIIWPVNGIITSRYGARTPTEIVSANHYGLDIGADIGTDVVAAINGTVTLVSDVGDYGKHIQIDNNDITTLYAHCSKLLVSNGENVAKGQKIAEVGQTGRATGPHLHFEVKRNGKTIDPELVLN